MSVPFDLRARVACDCQTCREGNLCRRASLFVSEFACVREEERERMEGEKRFGATGGNIISGGPVHRSFTAYGGDLGLVIWIRHTFRRLFRKTKHVSLPPKRVPGGFMSECRICGRLTVHPAGSVAYDLYESFEIFKKFKDTDGEPVLEGVENG